MRRPGAAATRDLLARLRDNIPGVVLRSTFICGFPGETEEEHRALVEGAREVGFERGGAFAYSAEEGTPAAEMEGQLEQEIREDRKDELMALFQQQAEDWAESHVGHEIEVMVDRMEGEDAIARTQYDALDIDGTVRILATKLAPGTVQRVRVLAVEAMDLLATPVGLPAPFDSLVE